MAALSDNLLVYAILGYALAMLAYAVEYAFGSRSVVSRVAERELVGAGGPPVVETDTVPAADPGLAHLAGRVAYAATGLAWALHLAALVTRGLAAHRVPWGNMYEFVMAVCLVGATGWLILLTRRPGLRPLGLFVTLVLVLLLGIDGMLLYTKIAPLQPALNSYWLKIHVTAAITASGTFLVGFVAAAMTLIRTGYDEGKRSFPYSLGDRLPKGRLMVGGVFAAPGRRPGADHLPGARVRLPDLDLRGDLRGDLGRGGVGPVLGLGSEGDLVLHRLGDLRRVPARPRHPQRQAHRRHLDRGARLGGDDGQPVRGQPGHLRPALLRRGEVFSPTPGWPRCVWRSPASWSRPATGR